LKYVVNYMQRLGAA